MAILADVLGRNMRVALTLDYDAIMTAETVHRDTVVIEVRIGPIGRNMTIGTAITADDMGRPFTLHDDVIMTTHAGTDDLIVIDLIGIPVAVQVTCLANIAGLDMGIALPI